MDRIGTEIRGYKIDSKLDEGSICDVYVARHTTLPKICVFKFPRRPEYVNGLEREIEATSKLNHPNILPLIDCSLKGEVWISLPYIQNSPGVHNLDQFIGLDKKKVEERKSLELSAILELMRDLYSAISFAHANKIHHLDIKPNNILVDDTLHTYLTDFNLAENTNGYKSRQLSLSGKGGGSSKYCSPEQEDQGKGPIDERTDIYSLSLVFNSIIKKEFSRKPVIRPDIPKELNEILEGGLQEDYQKRCSSAKEIHEKICGVIAKYFSSVQKTVRTQLTRIRTMLNSTRGILELEKICTLKEKLEIMKDEFKSEGLPFISSDLERKVLKKYQSDVRLIEQFKEKSKKTPDELKQINPDELWTTLSKLNEYKSINNAWQDLLGLFKK